MKIASRGNYEIAKEELVAEGADLRVKILTLADGDFVPWHYHSEITDHFFCLEGVIVVETRAPRATHRLHPGQRCQVAPKTAHKVTGPGAFLLVQGVGVYDFVPVGA